MKTLAVTFFVISALGPAAPAAQSPAEPSAQRQAADETAKSWSGVLVDAACKASGEKGTCEVSSSTREFGIVTSDGKFARFDGKGNDLARSQAGGKAGSPQVTVTGKMSGEMIQVSSLQIS